MLNSAIEILPEDVVNKIAAGEIVERPAAIVKELVENSLDAKAKSISIRFSRGGKFSIVVEDDGFGMHREEALLSIERHATSKLRNIQDLNSLTTFGFRGEAIPSIASVSKFKLMTCSWDDVHGTEIIIDGGKIVDVKDCARFSGTKIVVESLFHNVPARRKFLKSDETESINIISLVKNLALVELDVKFFLFQNGNMIFVSPNSKNFGERINEIFKYNEKFIDFSHVEGDYAMGGAICDPTFGNICKKNIVIFVNDRLVRSNIVSYAICDALGPIFPNHRGILAYVFLKVNPSMVDVNVHPMKKEVRFKSEIAIKEFIKKALLDVIKKSNGVTVEEFIQHGKPQPTLQNLQRPQSLSLQSKPLVQSSPTISPDGKIFQKKIQFVEQKNLDILSMDKSSDCGWKFVGTAFGEIAIFEHKTGIIIFNIRLAISRVTYEKVMNRCNIASSQQLLLPIELSLLQDESEQFQRFLPIFLKNGFSVYSFGQYDYKIDAIPEWLSYQDAASLAHRLIAEENISTKTKNAQTLNMEEIFAKCISQISTLENYRTQDSIEKLRDSLLSCNNPLLCPFGNAIYFEFSLADMGRRFGIGITR
ncbi:MAG: DNA mismatch repair endonuclease MutL [Puniceicoccales bacterium]|jgi:DNA mismatch repair protein MutL|nr:DNA mismatch repair endonuclease MutL [Puniceicoccales bacterium]